MSEAKVALTKYEASSLANHLEYSILQEVRDAGPDYDNLDYLISLVHIYERCKKVNDNDGGAWISKEYSEKEEEEE